MIEFHLIFKVKLQHFASQSYILKISTQFFIMYHFKVIIGTSWELMLYKHKLI